MPIIGEFWAEVVRTIRTSIDVAIALCKITLLKVTSAVTGCWCPHEQADEVTLVLHYPGSRNLQRLPRPERRLQDVRKDGSDDNTVCFDADRPQQLDKRWRLGRIIPS